jgi:hypothetical protein
MCGVVSASPATEIVAIEGDPASPGNPVFQAGRCAHSVTAVDMGDVFGDANQPRAEAAIEVIGVDFEHADGGALQSAAGGPGQLETENGVDPFTLGRDKNAAPRVVRQFEQTIEGGPEPGTARLRGASGEFAAMGVLDTHRPDLLDWNHPFIKIGSKYRESTTNIGNSGPSNFQKDSANFVDPGR